MKRMWLFLLAATVVAALGGCGDDSTDPNVGEFEAEFTALPVLDADQYYEAWASFPIVPRDDGRTGGALAPLHDEAESVSLGAFRVVEDGIVSLDGGPVTFTLAEDRNLSLVSDIHVTVRSAGDTTHGAVVMGGEVTGSDTQGVANLDTSYHHAFNCDLRAAAGSCVMATPSDGAGTNETQGIWFTDGTGAPALDLPLLGEGWVYSAWVMNGTEPLAIGDFTDAHAADSDSAGAEAGSQPGFAAPGSDFLVSAIDFSLGGATVILTAEPGGEGHQHRGSRAMRHEEPFPITVLTAVIEPATPAHTPIVMSPPAEPLPTGHVTFGR